MDHPLYDLLLTGAEFSTVIDLAEQVLGNPVAFIDTAQNETTLSAHYPEEDMEDKAYRRQQISDEEYQKNTDYVTALSRTGIPQVLVWPHIRRKRLICGCLVYGRHVGGIRLPDVGNRLEDLDMDLVRKTAALIGVAYVLRTSRSEDKNCLWNLLNDRLDASLVDLHALFAASIPAWDSLCVLWFIPEYYPDYTSNLPLYQQSFASLSTCMTNCGAGFALLADADALRQVQPELTRQLQDLQLRVGVGRPGNTLAALRRSYDQARHSLRFASQAGNYGLALFGDYQLNYLISLIPADQAAAVLDDSPLTALETCDRQSGTEMLKTLRTYLRCGGNIKAAADQLCVHKNTVFYRIGKLREDWGLDLADTDTLSLLNCLFILKDQRNNDPDM